MNKEEIRKESIFKYWNTIGEQDSKELVANAMEHFEDLEQEGVVEMWAEEYLKKVKTPKLWEVMDFTNAPEFIAVIDVDIKDMIYVGKNKSTANIIASAPQLREKNTQLIKLLEKVYKYENDDDFKREKEIRAAEITDGCCSYKDVILSEIRMAIEVGDISGSTVVQIIRETHTPEELATVVETAIKEAKKSGEKKKATVKHVEKFKSPMQKLKEACDIIEDKGYNNFALIEELVTLLDDKKSTPSMIAKLFDK